MGDFNNDGNLDVLAVNSFYNPANGTFFAVGTVSVLQGNGDGTFAPGGTFSVGIGPASLAVGDFNNDGNLDVVVANSGDNTVSVLLGEGKGSFQTATPESGIANRDIPYLQDLNGDGVADELILAKSGDLLFRAGLAEGVNPFAPPVIVNLNQPARDATVFQTASGWAIAAVDETGDTVSIYVYDTATGSFVRQVGFSTGNLPVRIAAGALSGQSSNGQPLDDLVVANDFDNSVTIALQQADGSFSTQTRTVGVGTSDIALIDLGGASGPDLVVSDQVSGDVTVLFNDPTHSFVQQARYRAGIGLFDVSTDPGTGEHTVLSRLQTVGVVAADFTGASNGDLVVLDQGTKSFTLLPSQGSRSSFASPELAATYFPTSTQASQVVSLTLPGDALPSLAILMEDLGQVWVYRNQGNGSFAPPVKIDAGNDPSGISVATVKGTLAVRVGNAFGDILTLLYDGNGSFAPDRASLQNAPLAVGTIASTGQEFAVVADQESDLVSLYYRIPGTNQFSRPTPVSGTTQIPLLAPGAVQTFTVQGDANPYLVVANSLSNNVLLYHYDPLAGQFRLQTTYIVGDNPVAVTVADVNGDGVPDLLVVNEGSNDVSTLFGVFDSGGNWLAIPGPRLASGGVGPIAVRVVPDASSPGGNDLAVTNGQDGTLAILPGRGQGFFDARPTRHRGRPSTSSRQVARQ